MSEAEIILRRELKQLIVQTCNREVDPEDIPDDATLLGPDSILGLDSLDVLQINVAIQHRFGVRIEDGKQARRVMASIRDLARFIQTQR